MSKWIVAVLVVAAGVVFVVRAATPDRHEDLVRQREDNVTYLREVLPVLMPDAKDLKVSYDQDDSADTPSFVAAVTFTDADGPASFTVTVNADPTRSTPIDQVCPTATRPDGKPLCCSKTKQPNGDVVVIKEGGITQGLTDIVPEVTRLDAIDYRAGGHTVGIWNDRLVPGAGRTWRPTFPLTEQQLTALVTDPRLALH